MLSGIPKRVWPEAVVHHGARVLLLVVLGSAPVALFPAQPGVDVGSYQADTVAERDILAELEFEVPKDAAALERERDAAAASVIPTFVYRESARDSVLEALSGFFARIDSAAIDGTAGVLAVLSETGIEVTVQQVDFLADEDRREGLRSRSLAAIAEFAPAGIMAPSAASGLTTDSIRVERPGGATLVARSSVLSGREYYDRALAGMDAGTEVDLLRVILARYLATTLALDTVRTERDRQAARDTVPTTIARILRGEAIVRANQRVSPVEIQTLDAYGAELRAQGYSVGDPGFLNLLGGLILNTALLFVLGLLIFFFRRETYHAFRSVLTIAGIFAVYFLAAFLINGQSLPPASLPVTFVAIPLAILWGRRMALPAVFVLSSLTVVQEPFFSVHIFVTILAGGAAAAFAVHVFRRLAQTWVFIAIIALAYALVILGMQLRGTELAFLPSLLGALGSTVVGAILAIGFLPVFEWLTGITTDQTLIGWADPNRPLMRRLFVEAPGTYAHTMQVANLAEAGADAIGASALLCRAGSYYHDVGKMEKPDHFIENQQGDNPHDHLDPLESAAIVRDHVVKGVALARKEKIPRVVADFISEHHGDQVIGFFLRQARERAEDEGRPPPDPARFRYPGPRPRSRETAIVMLADAVESAGRAVKNPTRARMADLIEGIFSDRIQSGQLERTPLTFHDLTLLKERFAKVLGGIHHQRIDYPQTRHLTARPDAARETASPASPGLPALSSGERAGGG